MAIRTEFPAWLLVSAFVAVVAVAGFLFYAMSGAMNATQTTTPPPTTAAKTDPTTGANRPIQKGADPTGAKPVPAR